MLIIAQSPPQHSSVAAIHHLSEVFGQCLGLKPVQQRPLQQRRDGSSRSLQRSDFHIKPKLRHATCYHTYTRTHTLVYVSVFIPKSLNSRYCVNVIRNLVTVRQKGIETTTRFTKNTSWGSICSTKTLQIGDPSWLKPGKE